MKVPGFTNKIINLKNLNNARAFLTLFLTFFRACAYARGTHLRHEGARDDRTRWPATAMDNLPAPRTSLGTAASSAVRRSAHRLRCKTSQARPWTTLRVDHRLRLLLIFKNSFFGQPNSHSQLNFRQRQQIEPGGVF